MATKYNQTDNVNMTEKAHTKQEIWALGNICKIIKPDTNKNGRSQIIFKILNLHTACR